MIERAFGAWTLIDLMTGLSTDLRFIDDTQFTRTIGTGFNTVNYLGAEIDLLAADSGDADTRATSRFLVSAHEVTLTSGTVNYSGSGSIIGADINNNRNAVYSLALLVAPFNPAASIGLNQYSSDVINQNIFMLEGIDLPRNLLV